MNCMNLCYYERYERYEVYELHEVHEVYFLTEHDEEDGNEARAGEEQRPSPRPVHQEVREHLPAELEQPHLI